MFCRNCGSEIPEGTRFCPSCGTALAGNNGPAPKRTVATDAKNTVDKITRSINAMAGGEGVVELKFRDLFADVFHKHDANEGEEIFICGTKSTTPNESEISSEWPKPWLYSRVVVGLILAFLVLLVCVTKFGNIISVPGLILLGAFAMPVSVMIMFLEMNVPRNISFFTVLKVFFLGGCASILITLILDMNFLRPFEDGLTFCIVNALIEESAKFLLAAYFIKKSKKNKYILNGLLIGGAVGAGFAAFESAGYAFWILIRTTLETGIFDISSMLSNIVLRGILAPGGHVAWAAIEGAAIIIALNGREFKWDVLIEKPFIKLTAFSIVFHTIWNWNTIELLNSFSIFGINLKHYILIAAAWLVLIIIIQNGLKQINQMQKQNVQGGKIEKEVVADEMANVEFL